jgi:drug/metabolite transporter, DME family
LDLGLTSVLAAAVLWGTTGTAQALAPPGASSTAVGALRLTVGGIALLMLAVGLRELPDRHRWPRRTTLAAGLAVAAYQLCFFAAVARTGVAVGTLVAIGSAPVMAGLLGLFVRGEAPGRRWATATTLAVLGCSLLLGGGGGLQVDPVGVLLALGAGLSYAAYAGASKQLLNAHQPVAVMAVVFCLGALLLGADLAWLGDPRGLAVILHLGLIATALAYVLFARGLRRVPVSAAATYSLAEPLTAALLGTLLLGEHLSPTSLAGAALLLACGH